ncbi:MAG: transporter [Chitinophagaceae bacterium]
MKILVAFLLMALCSVHVLAQGTEPINTDRPDQSDGTYILPTKMIQIESGIIFSQTDRQLSDIIQTSMLRYGIAKKWELRLLTNEGFSGIPVIAKNSFGFYPITLSAKHALVDQKGMIPAITLVGYLKIPFAASKNNQLNYWAPSILLAFQNDLSDKLSVGYNAGLSWDGIEKKNSYLFTVSVGYSVSRQLSAFGEYFSNYSSLFSPSHNVDFGLEYLIKPTLQLDIAGGTSLFDNGASIFETMGVSYRFK